MENRLIAVGRVESLSLNGEPVSRITFGLTGPTGDKHAGLSRTLSRHDGTYVETSMLSRGARVFNWRSWTGLSEEENLEIKRKLSVNIPQGCLLENMVISGVPNFSQLPPTSRLVFPVRGGSSKSQAILAIWEENSPCRGVGDRLEKHYADQGYVQAPGLSTRFITVARGKRGVMGFVLSEGLVEVSDCVNVFLPVQ